MTVRDVNEMKDRTSRSGVPKPREIASPEMSINDEKITGNGAVKTMSDWIILEKTKVCAEVEMDQESGGSSEEFESPKSVVSKVWRWSGKSLVGCVHSQILKIREEDSHLGEDIGEGLSAKDMLCSGHYHFASQTDDAMLSSKPIMAFSPLSGKRPILI